jgi:hypothetical protein
MDEKSLAIEEAGTHSATLPLPASDTVQVGATKEDGADEINQIPKRSIAHLEEAGEDLKTPQVQFTQEEANRVYRKLDWNLMPLIFVLYSLSVLDRSNLGNARIAGMANDIDLSGNRYSWLATVFYIACKYAGFQAPFGQQMNKRLISGFYRYSLPMDTAWMESFQTARLGIKHRLPMGIHLHHTSCLYIVGWRHGLSSRPGNCGGHVRSWSPSVSVIFLSS